MREKNRDRRGKKIIHTVIVTFTEGLFGKIWVENVLPLKKRSSMTSTDMFYVMYIFYKTIRQHCYSVMSFIICSCFVVVGFCGHKLYSSNGTAEVNIYVKRIV